LIAAALAPLPAVYLHIAPITKKMLMKQAKTVEEQIAILAILITAKIQLKTVTKQTPTVVAVAPNAQTAKSAQTIQTASAIIALTESAQPSNLTSQIY